MKWKVTAIRVETHVKVIEVTALTQLQAEKLVELHLRYEKATIDAVLSNTHYEGTADWYVQNVEPLPWEPGHDDQV